MTITARYATRCPECQSLIEPGTEIEWEKGKKAIHIECPAAPAKTAAPAPKPAKSNGGAPSQKQLNYALKLLRKHCEPLLGDAFPKPSEAQVHEMSRADVSGLIDALREDIYGEY